MESRLDANFQGRTEPGADRRPDAPRPAAVQPARAVPSVERRSTDGAAVLAALLRRWRVLVVVPIVAILATVGLYLKQPTSYRATATVVVPTASQGQATAPVFVAQAVANFEGALRSQAVAQRTAAATGVRWPEVANGLAVKQNGTSQLVEASYTGTDRGAVSSVVETASEQALELVLGGSLDSARQQLDLANQSYDAAEQAITGFLTESGMVVPEQTFRKMNVRILGLRDALGHARATGDQAEAQRLEALIETKQALVTSQVVEYQRLLVNRQRAIDNLKAADSAYYAAKSFATGAEAGSSITPSAPVVVSKADQIARRLVAVAVIALALAVVLIVALEAAGTVRPPRAADDDGTTVRLPPEARSRGRREGAGA